MGPLSTINNLNDKTSSTDKVHSTKQDAKSNNDASKGECVSKHPLGHCNKHNHPTELISIPAW